MKPTIAIALLALAAPAAAAEDEVKVTEASGEAAIVGDVQAAKAAAKDDALRNCVLQVATTIVTAATETDQAQLLSDKVYSHSTGYIRKFEVLEDKQDGNVWSTKLKCEVSEGKLDDDLMAFGIAYRREGMPRIMVMIAEQAINATEATGWWQGGGNAADLRVMENSFMDRMSRSGFTFVDPEVLSGKVKLEVVGADPNAQQAREIGSLAGAEVVIVGRAIAKPLGSIALDNGTFYSAVANVSARAVDTKTGRILASAEFTGKAGKGFEQTTAGRNALSEGGRQLAGDLFAKIGKVWATKQSGTRSIDMVVKGIDDFARVSAFQTALVNGVKGVKGVEMRNMEDGKAELDVTLSGTTAAFATDLANRKLPGFTVKVKKVTQGSVEVEIK
jgi:curli biogenesis system outer membrane secretion channel CsgG